MDTRTCKRCDQTLPLNQFYKHPTCPLGRRMVCKRCERIVQKVYQSTEAYKERHRVRMREAYASGKCGRRNSDNLRKLRSRRRTLVAELKDKCLLCHEARKPCLDFHHLFGKDTEIANLTTANAIILEASKCIVLCANCHRLCHAGVLSLPIDVKPIDVTHFSVPDLRRWEYKSRTA